MNKIRSGQAVSAAALPTTSNQRRFVGSPDFALLGSSSSSAYFVESSRKAALGYQRRVLCLVLVSPLGLLIFVVAVGKPPQSSDLLLGPNEDGNSRTAKKQSSRITAERTTQAEETGADIISSADINEAKQKQTYSCNGGCLTTHVLDTANGIPAEGMGISLYRIQIAHASKDEQNQYADGERRTKLGTFTTNADGRIDGSSLLSGDDFIAGEYELNFHVSAYFDGRIEQQQHMKQRDGIPFLSKVPIRFGVDDATMHYHIPLLVSKYSYSTYRGS